MMTPDAAACQRLLREIDELRQHSPHLGLQRAAEIREAAARLDPKVLGERTWLELQAEVWMVVAGIYRSLCDLSGAEAALNVALAFLDGAFANDDAPRASCSPAHARLARRAAYLRCDQGRTEEALALVDDAINIYRRLAAPALAPAQVDRGVILTRAGQPTAAIEVLRAALATPEIEQQPRVFLAATHNLALLLLQTARAQGETREALRWLRLAERLHRTAPAELSLFKLRGLLGLTAFKLGSSEEALEHLWSAHDGFRRLQAVREQAGALLEIAAIELSRGATLIVKQLAGNLFSILRHPALEQDGAVGLLHFARAAQGGRATPELVQRVKEKLCRWDEPLGRAGPTRLDDLV